MRLKLIYNPAAGRGRARKLVRAAEEHLRSHGATVECEASGGAEELVRIAARASRSDYDRVVVCGGDGTLNLALRDFDLRSGTLALIPGGSGEDFARVHEIPRTLKAACDVVLGGIVKESDVALANGLRYLCVAGLGFDADVNEYANRHVSFLRGSAVYLWAIMRVLPGFVPRPVRITIDGVVREESMMFAAVGNTRQYGGGIRIVPAARPDDGMLDLCVVRQTSRAQLLKTLPLAYSGAHVRSPFVDVYRAREIRFESPVPMAVYADGEPLTHTPVAFGIAADRLRLVVPATRSA